MTRGSCSAVCKVFFFSFFCTAGYTPLHLACKHGYLDIAEELIKRGAVVNFIEGVESRLAQEGSRALAQLTVQPLNLALENNFPRVRVH